MDYNFIHPIDPNKKILLEKKLLHQKFKNSQLISKYEQKILSLDDDNKELTKKAVEFLSKPVLSSEGIAIVCFCLDPNGMRIELVEML